MAETFDYGQKGVNADVEHGKEGGRTIWTGTKFQDKENDGTTPARREVADPIDPLDAVNFRTVEGLLDGVVWKEAARLSTAAQLTGWIAAGSGVGKTLTSPDNLVSNNDFDSVTAAIGDRILVTDGPSAVDNGIYVMTTLADGAAQPAILTRTDDFDQDVNAAGEDEVRPGATVFVTEGTLRTGNQYTVLGTGPLTVDVSAINWTLTGSTAGIDPLIRVVTIGTGATQNIGIPLPAFAKVQRVKLSVTTGYDPGTSIEIRDDAPTTYMATSENNPKKLGTYLSEQEGFIVAGGTRQLQAIVGGAPGAGVAQVVVEYKL
ncbi:MAG: hypothetical protein V3T08_09730 [Gemmatimonadota bacterium]